MFLFPGNSCFPLSPDEENTQDSDDSVSPIIKRDDQLLKILRLLGKQDPGNLSFIKEERVLKYIKIANKSAGKNKFDSKFPGIS